jgi:transposase
LDGLAQTVSTVPDLPSPLPMVGTLRCAGPSTASTGSGLGIARRYRLIGMLHRRHLRGGEKRGDCVGKTKRGKGTKVMVVADAAGLPLAVHVESASPHEVTLVERTLEARFTVSTPKKLIGDKAYDSDPLDATLKAQGIELIAPHRRNRSKPKTQDGRKLRRYKRRYKRRWKVERLIGWLHNYRRLVVRYERHACNFLGLVKLACVCILLRAFMR